MPSCSACNRFSFSERPNLADRIDEVLEDGEALAAIGRRCLEIAQLRYSWDAVTDEYERLLESMC